jgi:hypothetical protein
MYPAVNAADHILPLQRTLRLFDFFPAFPERTREAAYQQKEEYCNKDEKQDSTQRVSSFGGPL